MDKQIEKSVLRRQQHRRLVKFAIISLAGAGMICGAMAMIRKSVAEENIRIGEVTRGPLETTVSGSGRVVPAFEEIINSPVESRILNVYVMAGDSIEAGTPLLQLDLESTESSYGKLLDEYAIRHEELMQQQLNNRTMLSELAMQIEVQQMNVNRMAVEVENERRLDSLGSGTGDRVRQAETSYATGMLELKQLRERLANERERCKATERVQQLGVSSFEKDIALMKRTLEMGKIPAPHAGVITFINNEIGGRIAAGEKVAVVSDLSQFKIEGEVPEGSSDRVGVGSLVNARIGGVELTGIVTNITPMAKSGMVNFSVKLDNPRNSRLRSGLRTELSVSYGYKDDVVRIPNGPFFKGPGDYSLWVVDHDGNLIKHKVTLGDSNRDYIEVVAGLTPGQKVVVSDMEEFVNYDNLKIRKKE